jgi:GNAT superfamily N-acetyltransferase
MATEFRSRLAGPVDAASVAEVVAEGFASYRRWAPADWEPPRLGADEVAGVAGMLERHDVWCLLALDDVNVIGHVALAPFTREESGPAPTGTSYLWQLFVRPSWQGRGVATWLMERAVAVARLRGFERLLLWTPSGAAQARRFYEREGWSQTERAHGHSGFGLPTVEYGRVINDARSGPYQEPLPHRRRRESLRTTAALSAPAARQWYVETLTAS